MKINSPNNNTNSLKKTFMGIDYGEANIGLAFGRNKLVMPIGIISGKNDESAINEITKYVIENKIDKIILGLPLSSEGKETNQSLKVRKFARLLKIRLKRPVEFTNEYRSSLDSKTESIHLGISKKRRREIDHLSAALILKQYFGRLKD